MRTLIVTVDPAFPPVSGAELRNWQNASAASRLGPVMLVSLCPLRPGSPPAGIELASLSAGVVWNADFDLSVSGPMLQSFRSLAQRFAPDMILLESLPMANLIAPAKAVAPRVVIDLHNIESDLAAGLGTPRHEVERIAALERLAMDAADQVWVCSARDRDLLDAPASIVPNGIPRPETVPASLPSSRARPDGDLTMLFVGHLNYPPNVEAALWLAELMPELRRHVPRARLVVAGRSAGAAIKAVARPGMIDVLVDPDSMVPLLERADIAVIPLRQGGGTRIKALEAMVWGLPVVATSKAVEGLELQDGTHVLLADSAADFISSIRKLAEQPEVFARQRAEAHAYVTEKFGPASIASSVARHARSGGDGNGRSPARSDRR